MLPISVMKGTRYAFHIGDSGDQTCLPYKLREGLNMLAIFSKGNQMLAMFQNFKIYFFQSTSKHVHFRSDLTGKNDAQ